MAYDIYVRHVIRQIMTKEKYLTISQASAYTGLSHRTIQRYVASGKLPSRKNESGVRQIPDRILKSYLKGGCSRCRTEQKALKEILVGLLELIPTQNLGMICKKRAIREMINKLGS